MSLVELGKILPPSQVSTSEHLLRRNVKRFRVGLVSKARRLVYHSTLGSRVIKKKEHRGQSAFNSELGRIHPPDKGKFPARLSVYLLYQELAWCPLSSEYGTCKIVTARFWL